MVVKLDSLYSSRDLQLICVKMFINIFYLILLNNKILFYATGCEIFWEETKHPHKCDFLGVVTIAALIWSCEKCETVPTRCIIFHLFPNATGQNFQTLTKGVFSW